MRDVRCRCYDGDTAAVAALLPRAPDAAPLSSGGDAAVDGDLGAQVESLVGLLRSVSGNVECVLETLRGCADQLKAITSRRKSERRTRAPLAAGEATGAGPAAAEVERTVLPALSPPPPPTPSSGAGRSDGGDDALLLQLLAERPTANGRRGPGGSGCSGGGGGLDDAHDLDWDLSGLELGHTQRSQMSLAAAVCVSWSADGTGNCDELAVVAPPQRSRDSRRQQQQQPPAVDGLCCASLRDYEEDMERALERCFPSSSSSSRDANSDDDEFVVVVGSGGGATDEVCCRSSNASPASPPPATTTNSSSTERLRLESDFDQHDVLWDCHSERGCGRGGNYCASECAQPDRANAVGGGGGCSEDGCNDDNDDENRVAYDPTVNTWRTYALTCAAEDRV